MGPVVGELVAQDDCESSEESEDANIVQSSVDEGAVALLLRRVRGLQDERRLREKQDACRVQELSNDKKEKIVSNLVTSFAHFPHNPSRDKRSISKTTLENAHTGCPLKKITSWLKTPPHTTATKIQIPACASTAVPIHRLCTMRPRGSCVASPGRPSRGSSSSYEDARTTLLPAVSGMPVAEAMAIWNRRGYEEDVDKHSFF